MAYKRETKIAGSLYSTIQWLYQAIKLKPKSTVFFVFLCYDGEAIRYAESKWLRKLEWHYSPKSPILMMIKCFSMALWRSFSNLKSLTLRKWFQLPDFEWENPLDPIAVRPKHIHAIDSLYGLYGYWWRLTTIAYSDSSNMRCPQTLSWRVTSHLSPDDIDRWPWLWYWRYRINRQWNCKNAALPQHKRHTRNEAHLFTLSGQWANTLCQHTHIVKLPPKWPYLYIVIWISELYICAANNGDSSSACNNWIGRRVIRWCCFLWKSENCIEHAIITPFHSTMFERQRNNRRKHWWRGLIHVFGIRLLASPSHNPGVPVCVCVCVSYAQARVDIAVASADWLCCVIPRAICYGHACACRLWPCVCVLYCTRCNERLQRITAADSGYKHSTTVLTDHKNKFNKLMIYSIFVFDFKLEPSASYWQQIVY